MSHAEIAPAYRKLGDSFFALGRYAEAVDAYITLVPYTYHENLNRKPVSIPSRPKLCPELVEGQSEGHIEGCGKFGESWRTCTLRYALHCVPRYSGC